MSAAFSTNHPLEATTAPSSVCSILASPTPMRAGG
jgi:hypothetical protein